MRQRLKPETRRDQILSAALILAEAQHYADITRDDIAHKAGVSMGLVTHHFGSMVQLRRALMRFAVQQECVPVVAQGLASRDAHALKAPDALKERAARHLIA